VTRSIEEVLVDGLERFNEGAFFEAHEVWEVAWRAEPKGPRRTLLQGLIQLAAAFHKLAERKEDGARKLFTGAAEKLQFLPDEVLDFRVSAARTLVDSWRAQLEASALLWRQLPKLPVPPRPKPMEEKSPLRCPYCGEAVVPNVDPGGEAKETWVEDCPVCCRPWTVQVHWDANVAQVTLTRDDE